MNPTDGSLDDLSALQQLAALRIGSSPVALEGSTGDSEQRIIRGSELFFKASDTFLIMSRLGLTRLGKYRMTTTVIDFPIWQNLVFPSFVLDA